MQIFTDGHTHTQFCPHGSGDDVEGMIRIAIDAGLTSYSITEHNPIPSALWDRFIGDRAILDTNSMTPDQMEDYFRQMEALKDKYKDQIELRIGMEFDYLEGFEDFTQSLLDQYGHRLDDALLSVHFVKWRDRYLAVDYSPEDYAEHMIQAFGSFQKAQEAYLETVYRSVCHEFGPHQPKRIGHMTLCQKFQHAFDEKTDFTPFSRNWIDRIIDRMAQSGYELDYNHAGLWKEYCKETYPPADIARLAADKGIALRYGSDSHGIAASKTAYAAGMQSY